MKSLTSPAPTSLVYRPPESHLSEGSDDGSDEGCETQITYTDANSDFRVKHWAFPDLDNRIRDCVEEYEGVFPKLNFSSPKVSLSASVTLEAVFLLISFPGVLLCILTGCILGPLQCEPSTLYLSFGCLHPPQIIKFCDA